MSLNTPHVRLSAPRRALRRATQINRSPRPGARRTRIWTTVGASGLTALGVVLAVTAPADASTSTVTTSSGVVTHGSITTTSSTIGWLLNCPLSHRLADDPIVHPGMHGMGHLHDFTGNASTDANSTYASMTASVNTQVADQFNGSTVKAGTSCAMSTYAPGTSADTGAYWRPSLYANGSILTPTVKDELYYRAKPVFGTNFVPFPPDTRLIVGNHMATSVQNNPALVQGHLYWECQGNTTTHYLTAPNKCASTGTEAILENVVFPSCYDGNPLTHSGPSGTDNNQFAYAVNGACPTGYPVKVPQLSEKFKYNNIPVGAHLQLSADMKGPLLETYTAHADFWNTWEQVGLKYLVDHCLNAQVSCGTNPIAPTS